MEQKCDLLLETLSLNATTENVKRPQIDISYEWRTFYYDLKAVLNSYKGNINSNFEDFLIHCYNVMFYPDAQNINNLKAAIYAFKIYTQEMVINEDEIWNYMHPKIAEISMKRFNDEHFADAVEAAYKEINTRVKNLYRNITGEEKDGSDLMHKAFTPQKPVLIFENLNTETGKNIQQGYMNIFSGAMMGIRNPKAHENVTLTKNEAVQRLMLASLLMSKVDQAVSNFRLED